MTKSFFRLTINGGFYDFPNLKDLLKELKKRWNKDTYLCTIRVMVGDGSCGFKVRGDMDTDLKQLRGWETDI